MTPDIRSTFTPAQSLSVTFDNTRQTTTSSTRTEYSPLLQSSFRAQLSQPLLQGFGNWINTRFIVQAKTNRRIADSAFRQQVIFTVGQVESIYWALVSAYEDEQAKERALQAVHATGERTTASSWRSARWRRWTS